MDTRADQIFARFKRYHLANPTIWALFKHFTEDRIRAGFRNYSAMAIVNRIRWECDVQVRDSMLKISNGYAAYYARMFAVAHPEYAEFFRCRRLTTLDRPAHEVDIDMIDTGPPDLAREAGLTKQLEELLAVKTEKENTNETDITASASVTAGHRMRQGANNQ